MFAPCYLSPHIVGMSLPMLSLCVRRALYQRLVTCSALMNFNLNHWEDLQARRSEVVTSSWQVVKKNFWLKKKTDGGQRNLNIAHTINNCLHLQFFFLNLLICVNPIVPCYFINLLNN